MKHTKSTSTDRRHERTSVERLFGRDWLSPGGGDAEPELRVGEGTREADDREPAGHVEPEEAFHRRIKACAHHRSLNVVTLCPLRASKRLKPGAPSASALPCSPAIAAVPDGKETSAKPR